MIALRREDARGRFDFDWLDTRHTFSFGEYYDPNQMGFRTLRVSYVLEHRDSLGTRSVIRPGEIQRMSAGTGVTHSEFNASASELVHFLQIWIVPDRHGREPSYEQKTIPDPDKRGTLRLIAGPRGSASVVTLHQDVRLYSVLLEREQEVVHELRPERHAWMQVARGAVTLDGQPLWQGDGAAVSAQPSLRLVGVELAEVLVFDLA